MTIEQLVSRADEALHARRVFGDPIAKNGLTLIPVARVMGGGGGARGAAPGTAGAEASADIGTALSGGLGLVAQPAGMYVVKGDEVRWVPAVDVNRMVRGFTFVAIVLLLVVGSIARAQARNR